METYDFAVPGSDPRIARCLGSRANFRTRSTTTPWPLRPPTTFAMRKMTACTPNVCAYADRRASSASFVAPDGNRLQRRIVLRRRDDGCLAVDGGRRREHHLRHLRRTAGLE